jgi:hypothetical protein
VTDEELKALFEQEARALGESAHVPAAGQIWWKSAIRARAEAAHVASRPMVWLQALTGAGVVGLALGGATALWPRLSGSLQQIYPELATSVVGSISLPMLVAGVVALLAAPLAVYLAIPRD